MVAQLEKDFYNKSFSHQGEDERDDSLQKRIKFWLNYVVDNDGAPKSINVYDYDYNDFERDSFC